MKNKLFGRLGERLKDNVLIIALLFAVGAAALFSYNTIKNINRQLEKQRLQNIEVTPDPNTEKEEQVQDVQTEQENVPLPNVSSKTTSVPDTSEEEPQEVKKKFILPVSGKIYSAFSADELVYNRTLDDWRTHNGIDISATKDDPVKAGADGNVEAVYSDGLLGTVVEINHGDFTAKYCGLSSKTFVNVGDSVSQGQNIGTVGEVMMEVNDQSHVHLEIVKDGKNINPDTLLK